MDFLDSLLKKNNMNAKFLTDTSRNGNPSARKGTYSCQQWCNIKGGLGFRPSNDVQ